MSLNCKHCGSEEYQFTLTPELTHYGKYTCVVCDSFMGWAKNPETVNINKQYMATTLELLGSANLSTWERQFLTSIGNQLNEGKTLSPSQLASLDKIGLRYINR